MPADPIDSPVARARTTKHLWLWGSLVFALVAWLVFWWVSSHQISVTLLDGRVVSYAGILKGKKVSESEFEPDLYAYTEDWDQSTLKRVLGFMERLFVPRPPGYADIAAYRTAPALLLIKATEPPSSTSDTRMYLDDGYGNELPLISWSSYSRRIVKSDGRSRVANDRPLPTRDSHWKFKFRDTENHALGEFAVPHGLYTPKPLFEGSRLPLESQNSKGILKLLSADYTDSGNENGRLVTLKFDASACPQLLPCHVIGVRITDSWGNTELVTGSLDSDGRTILAQWPVHSDERSAVMQSEDWQIKIALCRGYGGSFAPHEVAVFDHIPAIPTHPIAVKKLIGGRELTYRGGYIGRGPSPSVEWYNGHMFWDLDKTKPLLWPVFVHATCRTANGFTIEIDPSKHEQPSNKASYRVTRKVVVEDGIACGLYRLTKDYRFETDFMFPSGIVELDLHVALEEPQVFEFHARIANWPEASTKTQDARE